METFKCVICKLELNICEQVDDLNCCKSCHKEMNENPAYKFFEERDCAYCREYFDQGKNNCKECGFDLNSWNQQEECVMCKNEKTNYKEAQFDGLTFYICSDCEGDFVNPPKEECSCNCWDIADSECECVCHSQEENNNYWQCEECETEYQAKIPFVNINDLKYCLDCCEDLEECFECDKKFLRQHSFCVLANGAMPYCSKNCFSNA